MKGGSKDRRRDWKKYKMTKDFILHNGKSKEAP